MGTLTVGPIWIWISIGSNAGRSLGRRRWEQDLFEVTSTDLVCPRPSLLLDNHCAGIEARRLHALYIYLPPTIMSPLPPPARPPPAPVDPALVPHDSAGAQVNSVQWTLFSIATCFLAVRLYCKRISRQGIWWDDLILVIAWVVLLVASALLSVMVARGFGRHPWDQYWGSPNEILIMWVRNTLAMTAAAWSKTAFAVTLLRFADGWVKWAVWFILVTLNIVVALNSIMNWVGCEPIQRSWNPEIPGHCADILREIIIIGNIGGCECHPSRGFWPFN